MKKILAAILGLMLVSASAFAQKVSVVKDEKGWKIMDRGQNVEIKGVVWAFTPIGETHTFSLFDQSDEYIKAMIDTDMPMLKAMGVNTIRCFTMIPPKWVEYIYSKYGIYSIINDTLGRYGISVNGTWYGVTDYSDYYTRETLIAQAKRTAETYKDTKGVLMYLFGNESNYGLVWSSNEIESARLRGNEYYLYIVNYSEIGNEKYEPIIIKNPYKSIFEDSSYKLTPTSYLVDKIDS